MRRFEFKLQTLLDYRGRQKEQCQAKTAAAARYLQEAKLILRDLESEISNSIEDFYRQQRQMTSVQTYHNYDNYLARIKQQIAVQQNEVQRALAIYEECRSQLDELAKSCKLVEQLKDLARHQYRREILANEQKILDEQGLQVYLRASSQ